MPFFESVAEAIAAVEAGEVDVRFSGQGFNAQDVQPLLEVMKSSAVEGLWYVNLSRTRRLEALNS